MNNMYKMCDPGVLYSKVQLSLYWSDFGAGKKEFR